MAVGFRWRWSSLSRRPPQSGLPWPRFLSPLIEPDLQIFRIRLSDKTSRLHPRHVVPKPGRAHEPEAPVEVREWICPSLASPDFVLGAQPLAQPHRESGLVL